MEMKNSIHAAKAIKVLNGKKVSGRTLKVSVANNRFAPKEKETVPLFEKKKRPEKKEVETQPAKVKKKEQFGLAVLFENLKKLKTAK